MKIEDLTLTQTCFACPEQYDVTYKGKMAGYLRLRHGVFRVDCPDCGGDTVYKAHPKGDGIFADEERDYYIQNALEAIVEWHNKKESLNEIQ